jgi:hypothetical protein
MPLKVCALPFQHLRSCATGSLSERDGSPSVLTVCGRAAAARLASPGQLAAAAGPPPAADT